MFEYTALHWATFLSAALLLNLTPGPDMAFFMAHAARNGRKAGFFALLGGWLGMYLHVILAAIGLSAILASSAVAFQLIKLVGAAYLIWLGIAAWRSNGPADLPGTIQKPPAERIFWQGLLVAALNPKVAFFYLAFLPQFVVEGAGPTWAQLLLHGSLIVLVAILIEPFLVLVSARLASALVSNSNLSRWLDRILGTIFVGLGIRIALTER